LVVKHCKKIAFEIGVRETTGETGNFLLDTSKIEIMRL